MKEDMSQLYSYYYRYEYKEISEGVYERTLVKKDIDYAEKVVLDIGSGLDSASFFISRGAKKVVCINYDQKELDKINIPDNIEKINYCFENCNGFSYFIGNIKPDIVKIDVEASEIYLVSNELSEYIKVLKIPSFYIIEIHPIFNLDIADILKIWEMWCDKVGIKLVGLREFSHNTIENFNKNKLYMIYLEPIK